MKDPLHADPTPYEILGVSRDASRDEIDAAFKAGLVQRQSVPRLTAAKRALQDPVDRAVVDAFLYDPARAHAMLPDPVADPAALALPRRDATARAWREMLRARFPHPGSLHCLAVLWYWSAATTPDTDPPPLRVAWLRAVAAWASLVAGETCADGLPAEEADAVRDRLADRIRSSVRDRHEAAVQRGDAEAAAVYRDVEREWDAEVFAARRVASAAFDLPRGRLACGPRLLEELGLVAPIASELERARRARPDDPSLALARVALSGLARAESLVTANDPQGAIDLLEALAPEVQASDAVQQLLARALRLVARRHADADRVAEALDAWEGALVADRGELLAPLSGEIATFLIARVAAWQSSRRADALALLERGVRLVHDPRVSETLGELLAQSAIERVGAILREADYEQQGPRPELAAALASPLADLTRAVQLGSARGTEHAAFVRRIVVESQWAGRRPRREAFNDLPAAVRRRFAACASGRGQPAPLFREDAPRAGGRLLLALATLVALVVTMSAGFGVPGRALQGIGLLAWYGLLVFAMVWSLLSAASARTPGRMPYPAARYLFPFDIVDARDGTLHILPLRAAQKSEVVHHHDRGRYTYTSIDCTFPEAGTVTLRIRPKAKADAVLAGLQAAEETRASAFRSGDLRLVAALDPFAVDDGPALSSPPPMGESVP